MGGPTGKPSVPARTWPAVRWLMQKRWRLSRGLTLGGQVCVIDGDGRVLLVRHGYRPGWHFPGGGVEWGENVVDAALRELREEAGIIAKGAPVLHGIFNHARTFPGDHIVLYVVRQFEAEIARASTFEIAERHFFARTELPADINPGTKRRLGEVLDGKPVSLEW